MTKTRTTNPEPNSEPEERPKARRGDKARRTRERITRAAEVVFVRDGYRDARIADIASEADVAHGSFYTYFDSKEDVFRVVATQVVEDMYRSLDRAATEDHAAGLIRAGNELFIDLYERHASMLALIEQVATFSEDFRQMRLQLRHRLVMRAEHSIARMKASGEAEIGSLNPRMLANALSGMVEYFAYAWFILGESYERESALSTLDEIWSRALGINSPTKPGRRRPDSASSRKPAKKPAAKPAARTKAKR
jgi:AcrR family transcriptional regulator